MTSAKDGRVCGELVRGYRERRGLSQEELAHLSGVSDRTIRNIESGVRRAHRATMDQIMDALELHSDERDTVVAAWTGRHRPCSLPADIPDFVGRVHSLGLIAEVLRGPRSPGARSVCVLAGMGGVGKTALALHAAHSFAADYPDGQLYLDLRGTHSSPVDAGEALARLLDRLGMPASQLPREVDARAEMLRDRLSGRRCLLVLDDAATEAQVRPLLPGAGASAVVVTSRSRLPGLAGARLVELGVLDREEALGLLASVAGPGRIGKEAMAATSVVNLCGLLPLAVRVVAALLAGRSAWQVAHVADMLADEHHRLGVLAAGDVAVAASISLSYSTLPPKARRMLRLLGVLEAPDFPAWVGAALCDIPLDAATQLMERLVDAFLLENTATDQTGQHRYRFHDLVRIFARHHTADEMPLVDRREVLDRATRAWLTLAELAAGQIHGFASGLEPHTADRWPADERQIRAVVADPVPWLDAERAAIAATVGQAAGAGLAAKACDLAWSVSGYCSLHCHFTDWQAMMAKVATAAQLANDTAIETSATLGLASALAEQGDPRAAQALLRPAVDTAHRLGLPNLEVHARLSLAVIDRVSGDLASARAGFEHAIELATSAGIEVQRAYGLSEVGALYVAGGELDKAEQCFT
ncbi:MAG TPA: NB-ARC domain-containing protein, partial [Reyranella sp.]|nr:NB-ARC domain-containing protein [Reyranella sp.]